MSRPTGRSSFGRSFLRGVPRTVVALGVVSFFTDTSSEMIVPLLPAFLVGMGASAATLGFIEGFADTTAGFFKLISGALADRARRRKPLVVAGYAVSSLVKPLVALARAPWHVFAVRFLDRLGKGMRTSPRDVLVADVTPSSDHGRAFGLHRAMDHLGNVAGPLVAWLVLRGAGGSPSEAQLRGVFWWAAIPAGLAIVTLLLLVKEPARELSPSAKTTRFSVVPPKVPRLRRFLVAHFVYSLGQSTDAFLLLRAQELGVPVAELPLLAVALNVVKAGLSTPLGALADRVPRLALIFAGWSVYAASYLGFAFATSPWHAWALFLFFGLHFGLVEGSERAFIAQVAPAAETGRAFGSYHFVTAITALPASWIFGLLMRSHGATAAFLTGTALAGGGIALLAFVPRAPLRGNL
jgi:MFS family permease